MLKIGEFSKLTKVSIRMLHYYDQVELLKPAYIDQSTGYRLYCVAQLYEAQKIVLLRDLNFQIPEIKAALQNWPQAALIEDLNQKIKEKEALIQKERQQIKALQLVIESVYQHQIDTHANIVIKQIPTYQVISLRKKIATYHDEGMLWKELFTYVTKNRIAVVNRSDNNIALYHDEEHKEYDVDIEVCLVVDREYTCHAPFHYKMLTGVEQMACMFVQGSYQQLDKAYARLLFWLEKHPQYEMYGMNRQLCHRDYTNEVYEDDYLTEIQIPILKHND